MARRRHIVEEGVRFLVEFAVEIPLVTARLRAPNVGDGVDETAIDQGQAGRAEIRGDGDEITALWEGRA